MSLPNLTDSWSSMLIPANDTFHFREPYMPAALRRFFLQLLFRLFSGLRTRGTSVVLTPQWKRLLGYLATHKLADRIVLSLPDEREFPLYYFFLHSDFKKEMSDGLPPAVSGLGRGFSTDYDTAVSTAFGETLERVPFLYYRNSECVVGSTPEMKRKGPVIDPQLIDAFSDEERLLRPEMGRVDETSVFRWIPMQKLLGRGEKPEPVLAPAQLVYWRYKRAAGEPYLAPMSTHGGAGYFTKEGAILRGLQEWIQRDGFFGSWLTGEAPLRIDPNSIPHSDTTSLIKNIEALGFSIHLLDITPHDIPLPSVLCVLARERDSIARVSCGSGAHGNLEHAIHSAIEEALSIYHWLTRYKVDYELPETYDPLETRLRDQERLSWWASQPLSQLDFFLRGPLQRYEDAAGRYQARANTDSEELERVRSLLNKAGHQAYYFESDHQALRELGFHAVRTHVSGLLPMYHDSRDIPLRLFQKRMPDATFRNTLPHPFP